MEVTETVFDWAIVLSGLGAVLSLIAGLGFYATHNQRTYHRELSPRWRAATEDLWKREEPMARFLIRRVAPRLAILCGVLFVCAIVVLTIGYFV